MEHFGWFTRVGKLIVFVLAITWPNIPVLAVEDAAVDRPILYVRTNLVSDLGDPSLVNAWGISFFPGAPFWVSGAGTGVSTLYNGDGTKFPLTVTIPAPKSASTSAPTGQVANVTGDFLVPDPLATPKPARFIFATEDGTIAAWNGSGYGATQAVLVADNSAAKAIYKGLALGTNEQGNFLFATNFFSGKIDVLNKNFKSAAALFPSAFQDPAIPAGYAPFGIANINGDLFVTYAKQDATKHDDVAGPGNGFVDVFTTGGRLLRRFAARGRLNSPWGVAWAPLGFGKFGGSVLIGNFGDGRVNAYSLSGAFLGPLGPTPNTAFTIDGLWALIFGGAAKSNPDTLFFTAGPGDEKHGLFGSIQAK